MGAIISDKMKRARKLIEEQGFTQAEAARKTGIGKSAISMTPWYQEHAKKLRENKNAEETKTVSVPKSATRAKMRTRP